MAEVEEMYDYYRDRIGWPEEKLYRRTNAKACQRLVSHLSSLSNGRKLLDVGCGQGQLIREARRMGWDAVGIELSASAVEICTQNGIPVEKVDFFTLNPSQCCFDVIVMSELLEHVPKPSAFIAQASRLLTPGGILFLTTPNVDGVSRRAFGGEWRAVHPQHIQYFSRTTLSALLKSNGFPKVQVRAVSPSPNAFVKWVGVSRSRKHGPTVGASDARSREVATSTGLYDYVRPALRFVSDVTGLGDTLEAICRR